MPPITQRLNYFTGLFLQEDDFKLEQDYHRDRLRHHNQLLHTPGICEGLTVDAAIGATQVVVQAGTALDRQGQFIVLAANRTLTQADIGDNKGKTVLLVIQYGEQGVKKSSDESSPSRTEDSPKLLFVPTTDTTTSGVRLAQIEFNPDGSVKSKSDAVRVAAGVNIGDELSINKLTLRAPTVAPSLWPSMTSDPNGREIDVNGALSVSGALSVTGAATFQNATIQQNLTVTGTISGNINFGSQLRQMINLWNVSYGIGIQNATQYFRTDANFAWFLKGVHNDTTFNAGAGGTPLMVLNSVGNLGVGTTDPKDKLHVAGGNIRWGNNSMLFDNQGGSLELGGNNTTAGTGTPYIDFHFKDKTEDFNVRIINDADGRLAVVAPTLSISGNVGVGIAVPSHPLHVASTMGIRQGSLYMAGGLGWSSLSYNAHHNTANNDWVFPEAGRPSVTVEIDDAQNGGPRFEVFTTAAAPRTWASRFKIDGNTGSVIVPGSLAFGNQTRQMINLWDTSYGIGIQSSTQYYRTAGHFAWFLNGVHHNDTFNAGANGTPLMILNSGGNLGIGTNTIWNPQGWNRVIDLSGDQHARLGVRTSGTGGVVTAVYSHIDWGGPRGAIGTESNHPLTFVTNYSHRMTIDTAGNVGIGTTAPNTQLQVVGSIRATTPGTNRAIVISYGAEQDIYSENADLWINNTAARLTHIYNLRYRSSAPESSIELKENISDFSTEEALEMLDGLNIVRFNYKDDEGKTPYLGFIAEDVPAIIATADRKAVNTMNILSVVTRIVKEQEKEITNLQNNIKRLEAKLEGSGSAS